MPKLRIHIPRKIWKMVKTKVDSYISGKVREFRTNAGWSRGKLGREIHMSATTISLLEDKSRGITAFTLWKIASALGKTANDFMPDSAVLGDANSQHEQAKEIAISAIRKNRDRISSGS